MASPYEIPRQNTSSREGGGALTRKVSMSLSQPRTMKGYEDAFTQLNTPECGWLKVKQKQSKCVNQFPTEWETFWCVFDDGILSFAVGEAAAPEESLDISMEKVISLRTVLSQTLDATVRKQLPFRIGSQPGNMMDGVNDFRRLDSKNKVSTSLTAEDVNDLWGRTSSVRGDMFEMDNTSGLDVSRSVGARNHLFLRMDHRIGNSEIEAQPSQTSSSRSSPLVDTLGSSNGGVGDSIDASSSLAGTGDSDNEFMFDMEEDELISSQTRIGAGSYSEEENIRVLEQLRIASATAEKVNNTGTCESPHMQVSVTYGANTLRIEKFASEDAQNVPPLRWRSGACSLLGGRDKNEDRFAAVDDLCTPSGTCPDGGRFQGYYAVFDGHDGYQAADYCQTELHAALIQHPAFGSNLEQAITETCIASDNKFLGICKREKIYAGTTALGCIVRGNFLTVFGIGDCQAVLSRRGEAVNMNVPHKPGRPDEERRILDAKGWITEEKELYMGRLHRMDLTDQYIVDKAKEVKWVTINRVCGELGVSRAIGDPAYKGFTPGAVVDGCMLWPEDHDQIFMADLIIPNPDFMSTNLERGDDFLVIASDGLWDVVSEADTVERAGKLLEAGKTPEQVSDELAQLAMRSGSSDNITVVVVQFFHA